MRINNKYMAYTKIYDIYTTMMNDIEYRLEYLEYICVFLALDSIGPIAKSDHIHMMMISKSILKDVEEST